MPTGTVGGTVRVTVRVMLKDGVLDPAGRAIGVALLQLGYEGVGEVRVGKLIELELADGPDEAVAARAHEMARRLLANTVVERFEVEIGR